MQENIKIQLINNSVEILSAGLVYLLFIKIQQKIDFNNSFWCRVNNLKNRVNN